MAAVSKLSAKVIALPPAAPPPKALGHKHSLRTWIIWSVLVLFLASVGWYWRSYSQSKITFETLPLERGVIQASITATGTLNPVVNVQVGSTPTTFADSRSADCRSRWQTAFSSF
jgi:HlyD family secretion protein